MTTKPTLAAVETIYDFNFRDVPKTLRYIAERIEAGVYGEIGEAAFVLRGSEGLEIFGLGGADAGTSHLLFTAAAHKLIRPLLDQ
jgi:hypothetical protein